MAPATRPAGPYRLSIKASWFDKLTMRLSAISIARPYPEEALKAPSRRDEPGGLALL
jgi:hypothetical protein